MREIFVLFVFVLPCALLSASAQLWANWGMSHDAHVSSVSFAEESCCNGRLLGVKKATALPPNARTSVYNSNKYSEYQ